MAGEREMTVKTATKGGRGRDSGGGGGELRVEGDNYRQN